MATQMTPDRHSIIVLAINAVLLAAAVLAARLGAPAKAADLREAGAAPRRRAAQGAGNSASVFPVSR